MQYYGRAEEVALAIVEKFKAGEVGQPLADVWIKNLADVPSNRWSPRNRLIMHLVGGTHDARGFKQWQEVGRKVKKGTHALHILGPVTRNIKIKDDDGKEVTISKLFGFKSIPVHAIHNTEVFDDDLWAKANIKDEAIREFLDELPLKEVAQAWGIELAAYSGKEASAKGWYARNGVIGLGTKNLSTWTHELIHAAEDKLGALPKQYKGTEKQEAEVVAELGGATLLIMMGHDVEADTGGAWQYISSWAGEDNAVPTCLKVLNRVCEAIQLVMDTANFETLREAA